MITRARIVAFFAAAAAGLSLAGAPASAQAGGPRNPYVVRDLAVDETAADSVTARSQGVAKAKMTGAQRLVERLTLPEDRANLDVAAIARTAGVQTNQENERSTATRYITVLAITYTASSVRDMLTAKGVPFVDTQEGLGVLVPWAQGPLLNDWLAAWSVKQPDGSMLGRADNTVLTPYIASIGLRPGRPSWTDLQSEVAAAKTNHAVIADLSGGPGALSIRVSELRDGQETLVGEAGPFADYASARLGVISVMETAWKKASIVRTSGSSDLALAARFGDITQWVKIRKGLEGSRLVTSMVVESFSASGADIRLAYNGRPDQLTSDLRARGLALAQDAQGWVVQAQ